MTSTNPFLSGSPFSGVSAKCWAGNGSAAAIAANDAVTTPTTSTARARRREPLKCVQAFIVPPFCRPCLRRSALRVSGVSGPFQTRNSGDTALQRRGGARSRDARLVSALRNSEEALVARDPPVALIKMRAAPASRDPGVQPRSADHLPGTDGDAVQEGVVVQILPEADRLVPLSKHQASILAGERPDVVVDLHRLTFAHHREVRGCVWGQFADERARIALQRAILQRCEYALAARQDRHRERHPLLRPLVARRRNGRKGERRHEG